MCLMYMYIGFPSDCAGCSLPFAILPGIHKCMLCSLPSTILPGTHECMLCLLPFAILPGTHECMHALLASIYDTTRYTWMHALLASIYDTTRYTWMHALLACTCKAASSLSVLLLVYKGKRFLLVVCSSPLSRDFFVFLLIGCVTKEKGLLGLALNFPKSVMGASMRKWESCSWMPMWRATCMQFGRQSRTAGSQLRWECSWIESYRQSRTAGSQLR